MYCEYCGTHLLFLPALHSFLLLWGNNARIFLQKRYPSDLNIYLSGMAIAQVSQ